MANIVSFWNDSIGTCDGGAVVEVSGGTITYTYNWDDQMSTSNDTVVGLCEGTYYVTITDANGCEVTDSVQIINTVSIEENGLTKLIVYPNPAVEVINIIWDGDFHYELIDSQGKQVFSGSSNTTETIKLNDVSQLSLIHI